MRSCNSLYWRAVGCSVAITVVRWGPVRNTKAILSRTVGVCACGALAVADLGTSSHPNSRALARPARGERDAHHGQPLEAPRGRALATPIGCEDLNHGAHNARARAVCITSMTIFCELISSSRAGTRRHPPD